MLIVKSHKYKEHTGNFYSLVSSSINNNKNKITKVLEIKVYAYF
jgi:hypothetical protein